MSAIDTKATPATERQRGHPDIPSVISPWIDQGEQLPLLLAALLTELSD
jgi:hypothetical protein